MLSLISTLGGLIISGLPSLLDYFQKKSDRMYELEVLKIKMQEISSVPNGMSESKADEKSHLSKNKEKVISTPKTLDFWRDNHITTVRTVVTYIFILELVLINIGLSYWLYMHEWIIHDINDLQKASDVIFSSDEMAMLGGIIGFWFGARNWDKYGCKND